ncbi:hypothetical protein WSM22_45850 [Cytophagales bacterium WSM2-2]|nr:hypothetical protein WSM22_45850 [Cytophagales bacterium WSM2-2]
MKKTALGFALIITGIMMFVYTGFNFITLKNVVEIGPIDIRREVNHPIQWSPVAGVVLVVIGLLVIRSGKLKR